MFASLLLLAGLALATDTLSLSASASAIQFRDSVEIRWTLDDAQEGYLTHVGHVTGPGRRRVAPEETTTYTLLVDDGRTASTTVVVYGSRTSDRYPEPEQFDFPVRGTRRATSFVRFVDQARAYLQDSLRLAVRETPTVGGGYQFLTYPSETLTPRDSLPRQIRARRTAFLVEIESPAQPGGEIRFTVSTYMQYQRRVESTWRLEADEALYGAAARRVRAALER